MSVARGKATDFSCVTTKNMTMNGANFLEKLLDNQPVEWKKLGEVCRIVGRIGFRGYTRNDIVNKREGAISISPTNIQNQILNLSPEVSTYISWSKYEESPEIMIEEGDVVLAKTASVGKVGLVRSLPEKATINPQMVVLKDITCSPAYLYYYLTGTKFQTKIKSIAGVGSVPNISQSKLGTIEIPIPPLSVQSRIVEILDKFTSLEAELEAELELRKKQYAYYREQLLNFSYTPPSEFNVVYKKLGEVCKVQRGASPRPITKYLTDDKLNGIPWIKIGDTKVGEKYIEDTQERITQEGARKSRLLQKGDFVLSNSMSYGRPYILGISGCIHDGWASLSEISNSVLPDYLYYYLSSNEVQHYWTGKINSGSVSNLNSEIIKQLPIPIPPLSEQARIVEILDKFDTLTNSISEGLPLEIQLRKQQYEYYREQLLAFPHP